MNIRWRPSAAEALVLLTIIAGAAFSYYQLGSTFYACGRDVAGPEIRYWMGFVALQSLMFLGAAFSDPLQRAYRALQYLTLPLVAIPLAQLAMAYPRVFVFMGLLAGAYGFVIALRGNLGRMGASALPAITPGAALGEIAVFLLATVVVHSAFAFVALHSPGFALDDRWFVAIGAVSALIAGWIVRRDARMPPLSIGQVPPLALLVVVLLRAKLPDGAYDSLFYKATLPIMIADWRTAITGAIDHSLLGTDFLEIINSQLRIVDPAYPPAMTASLAFLGLWIVAPVAAKSLFRGFPGRGYGFAANALALMLVSLSEPLIAAGTAYQEPMMALLLAASLLPMGVSWLFLGAAIAIKASVLLIVPVIVIAQCWPFAADGVRKRAANLQGLRMGRARSVGLRGEILRSLAARPAVVIACLLLAAFVVGEQFYRNFAYTGRLTGISETLSSVTDPERRVMGDPIPDPYLESALPKGFKERYVNTFVHVLTLDRWIAPTEFTFHVIPTSRLIAVAAALSLLVPVFAVFRRDRIMVLLFATWIVCAFALLQLVTQGRHLFPLSFGAALLVALLIGRLAQGAVEASRPAMAAALCVALAMLAFGDQLVGTFINNGWECRRNIATGVVRNNYDRPETPVERKLAEVAAKYRAISSRRDVVPTILCQSTVERMRYLGTHYSYAKMSLDLNLRHLAARPDHARMLPTSLLALCFNSPDFAEAILPPDVRNEFVEVEGALGENGRAVRILVSRPLMSGAAPTSLVAKRMNPLAWLQGRSGHSDLMPLWGPALLTNTTSVNAPGGNGAFVMESGGQRTGVLISPFSLAFDDVEFGKAGRLAIELAMPHSNSDGMAVDFVFVGSDGARASARVAVGPKPAEAPVPAWESREIAVPPTVQGRGTLTVTATSPSGDPTADWVYFRRLELKTAPP